MTLTPAAAIILIVLIGRPRAAEAINLAASTVSLLSIVSDLGSRSQPKIPLLGRVRDH